VNRRNLLRFLGLGAAAAVVPYRIEIEAQPLEEPAAYRGVPGPGKVRIYVVGLDSGRVYDNRLHDPQLPVHIAAREMVLIRARGPGYRTLEIHHLGVSSVMLDMVEDKPL